MKASKNDVTQLWREPLRDANGRVVGGHVLNKTAFGVERNWWLWEHAEIFENSSALIVLPPPNVNLNRLARRILDAMRDENALAAQERALTPDDLTLTAKSNG